jgi:hypothetical protein
MAAAMASLRSGLSSIFTKDGGRDGDGDKENDAAEDEEEEEEKAYSEDEETAECVLQTIRPRRDRMLACS